MVVMATRVICMSASYKTTDLSRHVGYTHYFTEKKKKVYFCSYFIWQPKEEMSLSPVKVTLLCISLDLFTAALDSKNRTLAGEHSKSEWKYWHLKFLSWCCKKFTHQTAFIAFFPYCMFSNYLTISRLLHPICSTLSPTSVLLPSPDWFSILTTRQGSRRGPAKVPILHQEL